MHTCDKHDQGFSFLLKDYMDIVSNYINHKTEF